MLKFRSIIVEPRPHPALKAVLKNMCEKLKTPITIVHGTKNKGEILIQFIYYMKLII
jgi:hypothetical protein